MPSSEKKTEAEEAALAADVSADHAAKAAEQADKDATVAARAAAGGPVCPTCKHELVKHGDANPYKAGAWHCNGCGQCLRHKDGKWQPR